MEAISSQVDLNKLSKNAPIFDFQKLRWMNGMYIRECPIPALTDLFIPHIKEAGYSLDGIGRATIEEIVSILRKSCELLSDIGGLIGIFLNEVNEPDAGSSSGRSSTPAILPPPWRTA